MSHRRPDLREAGLEHALRHALRLAVDSVEPAADGLDRIRTKIEARPRVARTGWRTAYPTGLLGLLRTVWRYLEPAIIWLRYWTGAVAERFRPDEGRVGWFGWLRPAAAVATGLLVVTGASWAIAALPQQFSPADDSHSFGGPGSSTSAHSSAQNGSQAGGSTESSSPGPRGSAQAPLSCRTPSPTSSASASSTPTQSASASPTPSSTTPSPTPSSSTPTGSPTGSPSGSPSANSSVSGQAKQSALALPQLSTPTTTAKPSASASSKRSPCT
jgi:hypothetical protein